MTSREAAARPVHRCASVVPRTLCIELVARRRRTCGRRRCQNPMHQFGLARPTCHVPTRSPSPSVLRTSTSPAPAGEVSGRGFSATPHRPYDPPRQTTHRETPPMLARTLALTCACLLGLAAGAGAQTQPATPPATTAPAGTPPAAMPSATAPPTTAPTAAAPPAATAPAAATPAAAPAAPPTRSPRHHRSGHAHHADRQRA